MTRAQQIDPIPPFATASGYVCGYDPVECLRAEVARFKATNQYTPMLVTGFYLDASCVLTELDTARAELTALRKARENQSVLLRRLQRELDEYEERESTHNNQDERHAQKGTK